jgi:Cu(I)/Ag(I) efflux system membrane protein CusA/SilA
VEEVVFEGALLRLRPKVMTVATIFAGLIPIMYGTGTGSEIMQRIAAPMIGGMATATLLTLFLIPAVFTLWKRREIGYGTRPRRRLPRRRRGRYLPTATTPAE